MAEKDDLWSQLKASLNNEAPQKTAAAPQKTAVAPQKTAVAPQRTAAAPQKTAAAPATGGTELLETDAAHVPGETIMAGGKKYKIEKVLGSGAEGDIYVVSDQRQRYALKLCHAGFRTNTKVMPALQKLNGKKCIADILDYGDDFELLEYIPGGSAAKASLKGNAQAILAIVLKIGKVLEQLHSVGVLHKDVKPANILLRDKENWLCVLCDYGIADLIDKDGTCTTRQVRTPIYAAPEVYTGTITIEGSGTYIELSPKSDYYSLGMTILSLWMGEDAFRAQEARMAFDKINGRIAIPEDMPDPLAKICRGLLIKNPAKRWDWDEIERAARGEDVPVEEDVIIEDLNITFNASKHQIANTPEELAELMAGDEDLAIKYLYRGQIEKWLKPYPELALEMQDIVEKRYPKNQKTGLFAAIVLLSPDRPFPMSGVQRETGDPVSVKARTFKDVSNFCSMAVPDGDTIHRLNSDHFLVWARARDRALASTLAPSSPYLDTYKYRIQTIDPFSDIRLCNDPDAPDYAMTQEGIGRFLNEVYTIFWNQFEGDRERFVDKWELPEYAPMNRHIPLDLAVAIINDFLKPEEYHYITGFMDTKGQRFKRQRSWVRYCTDFDSDEYRDKAGPKDDAFRAQAAWMKVIKGFGVDPEYEFVDTAEKVTTRQELAHKDKKTLKHELDCRGLRGWLAVQHQEDPNADLTPQFAYENLLVDYLDDIGWIDDEAEPVLRFDEAVEEAENLLSEGKGKLRSLSIRSVLQHVFTIVFAILPALILLAMLVFSIIENPLLDVSGFKMERFIWILGIVIAAVIFFATDSDGCLIPIIGGAIGGFILVLLVKFLGQFILYIFAAIVLAVLIIFSIKTVFFHSQFAEDARRFTKPGFDEKVLEPLYFAFSDEESFDSSLNGVFDEQTIGWWKEDLKTRRRNMFIFIGAVWVLLAFSLLVPKSERFDRFSRPLIEKILPVREEPVLPLLDFESLQPGSRGEQVIALQEYLKETGYLKGSADGIYGQSTRRALSAFQKDNGLEETGVADKTTIETINTLAAEARKAAAQPKTE